MQIYAVNYFKLNCHLTKCFQKCIWDITLNKSLRGEIIQDYFPSLIHLRQIHENLISVDVDRVGGFEFYYWSVLFRFFFFFRKKKPNSFTRKQWISIFQCFPFNVFLCHWKPQLTPLLPARYNSLFKSLIWVHTKCIL